MTVGGGKYKLTKDSSPYSLGTDCLRSEIKETKFLSTGVRQADSDNVLKLIQKTIEGTKFHSTGVVPADCDRVSTVIRMMI